MPLRLLCRFFNIEDTILLSRVSSLPLSINDTDTIWIMRCFNKKIISIKMESYNNNISLEDLDETYVETDDRKIYEWLLDEYRDNRLLHIIEDGCNKTIRYYVDSELLYRLQDVTYVKCNYRHYNGLKFHETIFSQLLQVDIIDIIVIDCDVITVTHHSSLSSSGEKEYLSVANEVGYNVITRDLDSGEEYVHNSATITMKIVSHYYGYSEPIIINT